MAGSLAQAGEFLGNALIPETMARFQNMGAGQRQNEDVRALLFQPTAAVETSTPAAKAFEVNGRTYGQNTSASAPVSTINASGLTQAATLQRAAPQAFNAAALQSMIARMFPAPGEAYTLGADQVRYDANNNVIGRGPESASKLPAAIETALFQANGDPALAREIMASSNMNGEWALNKATGQPMFVTPQQLIKDGGRSFTKVPTGMKIESDGKGGFTMSTGDMAGGASAFGKPAQNLLEENYLKANEGYARLQGINNDFRPEFQQLGTRWSTLATAWKDKAGINVDPAERQMLQDYSAYRADTIDNLTKYIQEATGAAMGVQEGQRITKGIPNPGQGLFDGDSPIEFQSKMNATMKRLASVQARMAYARANGLDQKQMLAVPLDDMPKMINKKGNELREQYKAQNPGISQNALNEMVKSRLRQEFGLQ